MPDRDVGGIRQQIGEILGTVRALSDQMRKQEESAWRQEEKVSVQLSSVKDEHYRTTAAVNMRLDTIAGQVKEVDDKVKQVTSKVNDLTVAVADIKEPVDKLIDLRNKIVMYVAFGAGILTVVWYLVGPALQAGVKNLLNLK